MAERLPLPLAVYSALAARSGAFYRLIHAWRRRQGKDDPLRGAERFGNTNVSRPDGTLVWVHAASVGETVSVLPLIERLVGNGLKVVLTTVTRTSAELAAGRLPEGAVHQYACYDHPGFLGTFLGHWRPNLALVVESEIWPVTFLTVSGRGIPLVLVNGRMSAKSAATWARLPKSAARIFACFDRSLAQSDADAERFRRLGAGNVGVPGNLKFDGDTPPVDPAALSRLRQEMADRPCWLAALTHPGEDAAVLAAHRQLLQDRSELLLVLVPRHPQRAGEIEDLCRGQGLTSLRRSRDGEISEETQVYIGDTIGEMGLYYSLAESVFLGGSFVPVGGHNPLEALRAGCAVVTGPKVANARTTYQAMWDADAAVRLETPEELADAMRLLMTEEARRRELVAHAGQVMEKASGALDRTFQTLLPLLPDQGHLQDQQPEPGAVS